MKKGFLITSLAVLLVFSLSLMMQPISAKTTIGGMFLQELTGDERTWVGILFRSLPEGFGLGFEIEGIIPLQLAQETESPANLPYGQINPGLLLSIGNQFKIYGGANAIITLAEQQFNVLTDRFYAKAGVQLDIAFLSIFGQGRTLVPLDTNATYGIFDRLGMEFGVGLSF